MYRKYNIEKVVSTIIVAMCMVTGIALQMIIIILFGFTTVPIPRSVCVIGWIWGAILIYGTAGNLEKR